MDFITLHVLWTFRSFPEELLFGPDWGAVDLSNNVLWYEAIYQTKYITAYLSAPYLAHMFGGREPIKAIQCVKGEAC